MRPRLLAVDHMARDTGTASAYERFNEATAVSRGSHRLFALRDLYLLEASMRPRLLAVDHDSTFERPRCIQHAASMRPRLLAVDHRPIVSY